MHELAARRCRILICCALLLASPSLASAEWQFAPFFGWEFGGDTSFLDPEVATGNMHRAFGITVTRITRGPLGIEGVGLYIPGFFNDPKRPNDPNRPETRDIITSSRAYALMGNLVLAAPLQWNEYGLRPYLSGGLGLLGVDASDEPADLTPVHQALFGANIGGGAVGFLTERTGLRFDLRFYSNVRNLTDRENETINGRKHLRFWSGSIGLVIR